MKNNKNSLYKKALLVVATFTVSAKGTSDFGHPVNDICFSNSIFSGRRKMGKGAPFLPIFSDFAKEWHYFSTLRLFGTSPPLFLRCASNFQLFVFSSHSHFIVLIFAQNALFLRFFILSINLCLMVLYLTDPLNKMVE